MLLISAHRLPAPISEVPESPSPTSTVAPTTNLTGLSINVVENFVKGLSANNADTQVQFYADEVSYYEMGKVNKHAVREDLAGVQNPKETNCCTKKEVASVGLVIDRFLHRHAPSLALTLAR